MSDRRPILLVSAGTAHDRTREAGTERSSSSRPEEVRAAVRNEGAGFSGWLGKELRWGLGTLARIFCSVVTYRALVNLMTGGAINPAVYDSASEIWGSGTPERDSGFKMGERPFGSRFAAGFESSRPPGFRPPSGGGPGESGARNGSAGMPRAPEFVATIGAYSFYLHDTIIDPERQFWECPLLYRNPCADCFFFVTAASGRQYCAAYEKLRRIVQDQDDADDLHELREHLRRNG